MDFLHGLFAPRSDLSGSKIVAIAIAIAFVVIETFIRLIAFHQIINTVTTTEK